MRDIKAGKVDVVIVTKMDRLARNLKLLLELWDTIEAIMEDGTPCGHTLTGTGGRRYHCSYLAPTGGRKTHKVALQPVEDAVWMALCGMLTDPSTVLDQARALADASTDVAQEMDAQIARLDKEMAKQDAKQAALLDLYLDKGVSKTQYTVKVAAMETQQQELRTQIAALEARRDAARDRAPCPAAAPCACSRSTGGNNLDIGRHTVLLGFYVATYAE